MILVLKSEEQENELGSWDKEEDHWLWREQRKKLHIYQEGKGLWQGKLAVKDKCFCCFSSLYSSCPKN